MHFYVQDRSYQFKALPFGLSLAPMEFTVVAKEVKLMALQRGIRIQQYLDNWLVRATSHQTCLHHTQTLVALCRELGWLVNKEKSELDPKEVSLVLHQLTKAPFEPLREASLKHLTFKTVFLLALGSGKRRSEIHIRTSDTSQTGLSCLCVPLPAFYPRTSWLRRDHIVWPLWLYQPWPPPWISHLQVTGPYVQSEPCVITWTEPQILGRTRSWSLFPSRKVLIRTSHLPLSPHGSSRL